MQVENSHIKPQNNMDFLDQQQELPLNIHEGQSSNTKHKRCNTENNNIYKRKRESRNNPNKI